VRTLMTLSRGYGARALLFVQSLAQLREAYSDATTLIENAGTIATFGHTQRTMSTTMADLFGDVSPDQLQQMPRDGLAVKRPGEATQFLRRCDYLSDAEFSERAAPNPMFALQGGAAS
jgi:type IV secretory pathway TraG/TraD family ATPase VirD4